jgi:hypothetical protein
MNSQPPVVQECQRVQVSRETQGNDQVVRISVERYHATLGWYTASALTLPLCQLPLLEQAIGELSAVERKCSDCDETNCGRKIIPFPLTAGTAKTEVIAEAAS